MVLHYWMVEWELEQGQEQIVETLPHPKVHLVFSFNDGSASVHGVQTRKFRRILQGRTLVCCLSFPASAALFSLRHDAIRA